MVKLFYRDSLWSIVAGPTIWAVHFLFSYVAIAIFCAKRPDAEMHFDTLRVIIGGATLVALVGIVMAGVQATDNWRQALNAHWIADADTLDMRRRFVGRAAFLLAGLSGIAVIYTGLPVIFIASCR